MQHPVDIPPLGRFPGLPAEVLDRDQAALAAEFVQRRGLVPGPYKIWLANPGFAKTLKALSDRLLRGGALSQRECEIATLLVGRHLDAAFVVAAHRRIAADAGLPHAAIEAICAGQQPALEAPRERAVFRAAREMLTGRPVDPAAHAEAVQLLGHAALCELSGLMGFYCSCAFILSFYDVQPAEG